MDKSFVVILIAITVIAFSSSAYIFSENQILGNINIASNFPSDKDEYLTKINECMEENTTVDGSIALNSFTASLLYDLKERAENAENIDELEFLLEQVYKTPNCKP